MSTNNTPQVPKGSFSSFLAISAAGPLAVSPSSKVKAFECVPLFSVRVSERQHLPEDGYLLLKMQPMS